MLADELTQAEARRLVAYVRLAILTLASEMAVADLLVELEREAIVLMNGATMIGDPEGERPEIEGRELGKLLYRAQSFGPEWEALVANALRAHKTGELPERWTARL